MNLFTIAWKSLWQRALASSLTALSVALGVALMVSVLVINRVIDSFFNQDQSGYHLVVGAKGSPLQLVLNTLFHVSTPVENIPYLYYKELAKKPGVKHALPMAMGDTTQEGGFRIVGTTPEFFAVPYLPDREFRVRGTFLRRRHDAVIGWEVARTNRWDVGSSFFPVHGVGPSSHVHKEDKFTVVGVLGRTGTANDKAVFIDLEGFLQIKGHEKPADEAAAKAKAFQAVAGQPAPPQPEPEPAAHDDHAHDDHDHHDHAGHHHDIPDEQKEVTAVLIVIDQDYLELTPRLLNEVNEGPYAQAASPLQQISWLMSKVVGNVRLLLVVMTTLILIVSGVSIFVSIYNSMADRRREIAIMRALGAHRGNVFAIIIAESVLLCVGGGLVGLLLGHGLVFVAAPLVEAQSGLLINPWAYDWQEAVLLPILIVAAGLVGLVPGLTAYRTEVAKNLA